MGVLLQTKKGRREMITTSFLSEPMAMMKNPCFSDPNDNLAVVCGSHKTNKPTDFRRKTRLRLG